MQESKPLTKRQKETLDFISSFLRVNSYSPSLKEITRFLKTKNLSTAQYFVEELAKKGYLKKEAKKTRGIIPTTKAQNVPLLGIIAAGKPIEPLENPEQITVPKDIHLDSRYPYYALKVTGDSMMDMGILDGDIVLIRHQLTAKDKDVVIAFTENGATLKVFRKSKGSIYLEPKNKDYPPIYPKQLEIRGKFCGLIRNCS